MKADQQPMQGAGLMPGKISGIVAHDSEQVELSMAGITKQLGTGGLCLMSLHLSCRGQSIIYKVGIEMNLKAINEQYS